MIPSADSKPGPPRQPAGITRAMEKREKREQREQRAKRRWMRIPLWKIYRAFPELDPFTDRQCERYVAQARTHSRVMKLAAGVASVALAVTVFVVGVRFVAPAVGSLPAMARYRDEVWAVLFGATCLASALSALLVRDVWMRWAVGRRLGGARCEQCDYSLLGLPVQQGAVVCPECGGRFFLADHDLTPADLLAPTGKAAEAE